MYNLFREQKQKLKQSENVAKNSKANLIWLSSRREPFFFALFSFDVPLINRTSKLFTQSNPCVSQARMHKSLGLTWGMLLIVLPRSSRSARNVI